MSGKGPEFDSVSCDENQCATHVKVDVKCFKLGELRPCARHRVRVRVRGSVHVYLVCEVVILA